MAGAQLRSMYVNYAPLRMIRDKPEHGLLQIRQIELSSTIMVCFVPVIAGPRYMGMGQGFDQEQ